jgi:hypothetical protein
LTNVKFDAPAKAGDAATSKAAKISVFMGSVYIPVTLAAK